MLGEACEWVGSGAWSNDRLQIYPSWVWVFLELNFVVTVYFVRLHFSTAIEYILYWSALNKVNLDKVEIV